jgi:predicted RNase H-like nuclease
MIRPNLTVPSREAARRRHASDFSDAVVAAYIHDISARRRGPRPVRQERVCAEAQQPASAVA